MTAKSTTIRRVLTAAVSIPAAFLFNISAYAQNIWHVDASVTQCGDGTMWSTAFRYLQDALQNQQLQLDDQIWVAAGTYFVDQDCANPDGTGDRVSTFRLVERVWLLGGFNGTETLPQQRDPLTNITILSGALDFGDCPPPCGVPGAGDCFTPNPTPGCENGTCCCLVCDINPLCCDIEEGSWDALCVEVAKGVCGGAYHVVTAGAEITDSFTTIIDGFTIRDGTAAGGGDPLQDQGGGMLITGEPSVIRCIFTNNLADGQGGGVSIVGDGIEPQLINCEFRDNPGPQAGWIQHELTDGGALASDNATPTLTNCLFAKNEATRHGGAIYNLFGECPDGVECGPLTLINCTLADNVANNDDMFTGEGGGVFNAISATLVVDNCILWIFGIFGTVTYLCPG
ncbi:MAG: hypothetical protein IH830_13340 [Planctomycetes bacterium]|nr:hypothetical protein [Planctomycetota bacterium]